MCVIKKLKFEDYKNCLEAAQIENKINHLENSKINVHSLKEDHKEFIKNNKLILKTRQRFRSKKCNVFNEEINKITLSSNNDKKIQSTDSIETNSYGMNKDIVHAKKEIKCINIKKQYKNI